MKKLALSIMGLSLLLSCNSDDDSTATTEVATTDLELNLSGLEPLGANFVYEGWIIVEGNPVSTGTFTSVTFPQRFSVNKSQLEKASKFVLSIEPTNDTDPAPSKTKILAGDFAGSSASVNSWDMVGKLDTKIWGKFFLATPTDETAAMGVKDNDQNGVWFGVPAMPPTVGLGLPVLTEGWVYEGWVVTENGPISTGTFTAFDTADKSSAFSGIYPGPALPGEDFLVNAPNGLVFPLDVRGKQVVVSVEPYPDNSPMPFSIKPLVGTAGSATAPAVYDLTENIKSLPTGTVKR